LPHNNWLPLNEYSSKYKISLSTLRRRIRADEVDCKFEGGKYLLRDAPIAKHLKLAADSAPNVLRGTVASQTNSFWTDDGFFETSNKKELQNKHEFQSSNQTSNINKISEKREATRPASISDENNRNPESSSHEVANDLMAELKKAYVKVLHEKEEQILILKEEIVDLNTLIKILETENERMRLELHPQTSSTQIDWQGQALELDRD
jgi:hypothetical protein